MSMLINQDHMLLTVRGDSVKVKPVIAICVQAFCRVKRRQRIRTLIMLINQDNILLTMRGDIACVQAFCRQTRI